jgi:hypothetical protein
MSCSHPIHSLRIIGGAVRGGRLVGVLLECREPGCGEAIRTRVSEELGEVPVPGFRVELHPIALGGARADSLMAQTMTLDLGQVASGLGGDRNETVPSRTL